MTENLALANLLRVMKQMETRMKFDNAPVNIQNIQNKKQRRSKIVSFFSINLLLLVLSPGVFAQQAFFSTAEKAADKLHEVVLAKDPAAVKTMLGSENINLLPLEEIDELDRNLFLNAWKKSYQLIAGKKDQFFIGVGKLGWTFPIPLVKGKNGWYFDTAAGIEIIKTRRIGRNELSSIQAAMAYYDAQKEYAEQDRNGDGSLEYAQKFLSTPGKKDGLYWAVKSGESPSPLGSLFAAETPEGAYHGYYYKILKGQGKNAKGGAYNYLSGKRMNYGFALLAWPAEYGDSGVMSFSINQDGILYEMDLGSDTDKLAPKMTLFNPDEGWVRSEENP